MWLPPRAPWILPTAQRKASPGCGRLSPSRREGSVDYVCARPFFRVGVLKISFSELDSSFSRFELLVRSTKKFRKIGTFIFKSRNLAPKEIHFSTLFNVTPRPRQQQTHPSTFSNHFQNPSSLLQHAEQITPTQHSAPCVIIVLHYY